MAELTEDAIEQNLIDLPQQQGYTYFNNSSIAPYSDNPQRDASVVLEEQFKVALKKLNPDLPESARHEAFQHVLHLGTNDIMSNNEKFHQMLCDGVTVEYFKEGRSVGLQVKLIDFENIQNNNFWVINQFVIKENNQSKRLDVILFVNGLPLVVVELKSATSEKATLERAYTQIQNYKTAIPSIFNYNALCIISDGIDARVSTLSAPYSRFLAWKSPRRDENGILPELQVMTERMFKPEMLLKLIRFNTVFESEEIKDEVAFFQAIKSRINKFTPSGGKTDSQVDSAIKQIVDGALASDGVVDIFEAAGVKAPSLDILSEEFLLEVKNIAHKNLAFELLRKLLNDEVKVRKQKNMTQGKKFYEMLSNVIKRYHNNQIDTAQVIKELSDIARDMKLEDSKAQEVESKADIGNTVY